MSEAICDFPDCGEKFEAPDDAPAVQSAKAQLGRHRRKVHGIVGVTNPGNRRRSSSRRPRNTPRPRPPAAETSDVKDPTPELFVPSPEPEKKKGFLRSWLTHEQAPTKPGEVRPKRPKPERKQPPKRKSLAPAISFGWGSGLAPMVNTTGAFPVARVLEIQAPAAGKILDRALKGTVLDRIIQPLAGEADKWGDVGMLFAFPITMAAYCQSQNPMTEQALRWTMRSNMVAIAESLEERQEDEAEFAESVGKLSSIGLVVPGDPDPIGTLIRMLMTPSEPAPPAPSPNGAAAVVTQEVPA